MSGNQLDVSLLGEPPVMTIDLRGELTSSATDALSGAYRQATDQGTRSIVINFADVDLMNSAGISLLIGILIETRKVNQRLIFAGLTAHYRKVLTMMGLTRHVEVCDTVADAYQSIGQKV
jgi:anti-sigma B factor antagonist